MSTLLTVNAENPQKRFILMAKKTLEEGGVIIYPTDTVYAYGCDINQRHAIEKIYRMKKLDNRKPLSFIFAEFGDLPPYVLHLSNQAFKIMKKGLPGPYTFIVHASKLIPRIAVTNQKTIGIRIPDNNIARDLVRALGRPIISASVQTVDGNYVHDPQELEKLYRNDIDLVLDAGTMTPDPSTVVDLTGETPVIIREGKGEIFFDIGE